MPFCAALLEECIQFWFRHGVDHELGGILTCMTEDGRRLSDDKYIWSQARWAWICSALYNRIEKRPEWLEAARKTVDFLLMYGRDEQGRWRFAVTRDGRPKEPHTSIFADCFAVYAFNEYFRATGDQTVLAVAQADFDRIRHRIEQPDFNELAPASVPPRRRLHAVSMIMTEVANELGRTQEADEYALRVMNHFLRPDLRAVVEFLDWNYTPLPPPEGTAVEPGHAIESMWFVLHWAKRRNRPDMIERAIECIRWHLELGWDQQYGGLFLGADAQGNEPAIPNWDKKIWWPHTEALYALHLAHKLTGRPWCLEWFKKIEAYCDRYFYMPQTGEWRQRLDRQGNPITSLIALPVKDPFHLPRALLLIQCGP